MTYELLILDLNGTFMFEQDRLGPEQDFGHTYRQLGGEALSGQTVAIIIAELVACMTALGKRPERWDSFPSVRDCLGTLASARPLPASELQRVEQVVARHELGTIPAEYARVVSSLAGAFRLALVSNLWSDKGPWLCELERVGLAEAFEWLVFSSDGPHVKPSPHIFQSIFDGWTGDRDRALMIGDSLESDVGAARAVGIRSLWLSGGRSVSARMPAPDHVLTDLLELESSGILASPPAASGSST